MKSPFPGMDPYLESRWGDIHATLVPYIKEALQAYLPAGLRARVETDVLLEAEDEKSVYRPDVSMLEEPWHGAIRGRQVDAAAGVAMAEPVTVQIIREPVKQRRVNIIDTSNGNRLVTAIEVLSVSNKGPGKGNDNYRRKLDDYLVGGVNVVEIDLIRGATRGRLEWAERDIPPRRQAEYYVGLRRVTRPARWEVYPMPLRERLSPFPIPLRPTDAELLLDLQPLIARAYESGAHDDID